MLINREPLESKVATGTVMRFNWSWEIDWRFHSQIRHAILHDFEINGDNTRHLDSSTEGNLAVTLREVQVADTEFCSLNVDREENLAATTQVLDVTISTMFRTTCYEVRFTFLGFLERVDSTWNGPSSFSANFRFDVLVCRASVNILWFGRLGNDSVEFVCCNELSFTLVPCGKDLSGVNFESLEL
jgi:hypothetical protein